MKVYSPHKNPSFFRIIILASFLVFGLLPSAKCQVKSVMQSTKPDTNYLSNVIQELKKQWPQNRTINLVFHGHSVPCGYQKTPDITTFDSYPLLVLQLLSKEYHFAVINVIKTSIGGENSEQGAKRFKKDVLCKQPDVVFIDYALNDRRIGLKRAKIAWEKMIKKALKADVKLVLMTPTPDISENIEDDGSPLAKHRIQIIELGKKYNIPVVDSYKAFRDLAHSGVNLKQYMAQSNHINPLGHKIVAKLVANLFNDSSDSKDFIPLIKNVPNQQIGR